jgi:hypothetical protein
MSFPFFGKEGVHFCHVWFIFIFGVPGIYSSITIPLKVCEKSRRLLTNKKEKNPGLKKFFFLWFTWWCQFSHAAQRLLHWSSDFVVGTGRTVLPPPPLSLSTANSKSTICYSSHCPRIFKKSWSNHFWFHLGGGDLLMNFCGHFPSTPFPPPIERLLLVASLPPHFFFL